MNLRSVFGGMTGCPVLLRSDRAREAGDEAVAADDDQFAGPPGAGTGHGGRERGVGRAEDREPLGTTAEPLDPVRAHGRDETGADERGGKVAPRARLDVRGEELENAVGQAQAGPVGVAVGAEARQLKVIGVAEVRRPAQGDRHEVAVVREPGTPGERRVAARRRAGRG